MTIVVWAAPVSPQGAASHCLYAGAVSANRPAAQASIVGTPPAAPPMCSRQRFPSRCPHTRATNPQSLSRDSSCDRGNASPKLGPVAWTTRGRVHSSKVKKPHGKRVTRKENARLFPPALKTHQNCNSRVGEPICTKSVSWKVAEKRRINFPPLYRTASTRL